MHKTSGSCYLDDCLSVNLSLAVWTLNWLVLVWLFAGCCNYLVSCTWVTTWIETLYQCCWYTPLSPDLHYKCSILVKYIALLSLLSLLNGLVFIYIKCSDCLLSDMWAVGCIFAELLTLKPLFQGQEVKATPNPFQVLKMTFKTRFDYLLLVEISRCIYHLCSLIDHLLGWIVYLFLLILELVVVLDYFPTFSLPCLVFVVAAICFRLPWSLSSRARLPIDMNIYDYV